MKRIISILLTIVLCVSVLAANAYADNTAMDYCDNLLKNFDDLQDNHLLTLFVSTISEMYTRRLINENQLIGMAGNVDYEQLHSNGLLRDDLYSALAELDSYRGYTTSQSTYSFGQGTYIVGQDLQPGTYDVKCESVNDEGYSDSINALGDAYSGLGLSDYGAAFGSLGDLYGALEAMTISIEYSNGTYANYLTLKSGETARIVLENGMRLDLRDGTSTFTFIR